MCEGAGRRLIMGRVSTILCKPCGGTGRLTGDLLKTFIAKLQDEIAKTEDVQARRKAFLSKAEAALSEETKRS
jgi:hypothetical protein